MTVAPPRQRILEAASLLFGRQGIRAVGVNALIAEAGVAKASFYRHFPTKVDLVVAWLRSPSARWFDEVRAETERRADAPREQLLVFFEVLGDWLRAHGPRGCPYLRTAAELDDRWMAIRDVVVAFLNELEEYLRRLASEAGIDEPDVVARRLQLVCAGSMSLTSALGEPSISRTALDTARLVVERASPG